MGSLTDNVPKPMLQIKGKPILAHKLEALPVEIDEVILVIGYLGDQIRQYFGSFYAGKKISYVEQLQLNGSGGALELAKDLLRDDFLVMMGDDLYMREDIESCMKKDLAVLGFQVDNPTEFGVITLNEEHNLAGIVEKPAIVGAALVNTALYKLNKKFFNYPLTALGNGEYGLPQTLALMARDLPVSVQTATNWFPIGNAGSLKKAQDIVDKFI